MTKADNPVISAQVLLKASGGTTPRAADLTAAKIGAVVPAPEIVSTVTQSLTSAGFDVGPVVGLTFSISGPRSLFESVFGIKAAGMKKGEISLARAPAPVRRAVAAITFPPPPDFGPGSYS